MPPLEDDLPPCAQKYLSEIKSGRPLGTFKRQRTSILRFYRWMEREKIKISSLKPHHLKEFREWSYENDQINRGTSKVELYNARSYVIWLIRNNFLDQHATDFYHFSIKHTKLPDYTEEFIRQRGSVSKFAPKRYRQLFHLFHNWCLDQRISLNNLTRQQVRSFLSFLNKRGYTKKQLYIRKLRLRIYLDWLRDRDLIEIESDSLFNTTQQYRNFELPSYGEEYLSELLTYLKIKTVISYRPALNGFHRFLHNNQINITELNRQHLAKWRKLLLEKGYSPASRLSKLVNIKGYLWWLVDREIIDVNVEHLIRSKDLPRPPEYLPKPLPPEIDQEIQQRLNQSDNIYHKGILLARYTGIRLGELSELRYHCIETDSQGRKFIKVPLGKMNRERLVPIDQKTISLIECIQRLSLPHLERHGSPLDGGPLTLGPKGGSAFHNFYRQFKILCKDLTSAGSIYPHRLRHTFATSLLNAGLSIHSIMVLLGHRDLRMTYRYSALAQETMCKEYFRALENIENKIEFSPPKIHMTNKEFNPTEMLQNLAKWLQKEKDNGDRRVTLLIKRIHKLRSEITAL